jgi:Cu+-exporting ATPase
MKVQDAVIPASAHKVLGASFAQHLTERNILSSALALESQSDHPLAQAISSYCISRGAEQLPVTDLTQTPGIGIAASNRTTTSDPNTKKTLFFKISS